jgi:hypothetical protein
MGEGVPSKSLVPFSDFFLQKPKLFLKEGILPLCGAVPPQHEPPHRTRTAHATRSSRTSLTRNQRQTIVPKP